MTRWWKIASLLGDGKVWGFLFAGAKNGRAWKARPHVWQAVRVCMPSLVPVDAAFAPSWALMPVRYSMERGSDLTRDFDGTCRSCEQPFLCMRAAIRVNIEWYMSHPAHITPYLLFTLHGNIMTCSLAPSSHVLPPNLYNYIFVCEGRVVKALQVTNNLPPLI